MFSKLNINNFSSLDQVGKDYDSSSSGEDNNNSRKTNLPQDHISFLFNSPTNDEEYQLIQQQVNKMSSQQFQLFIFELSKKYPNTRFDLPPKTPPRSIHCSQQLTYELACSPTDFISLQRNFMNSIMNGPDDFSPTDSPPYDINPRARGRGRSRRVNTPSRPTKCTTRNRYFYMNGNRYVHSKKWSPITDCALRRILERFQDSTEDEFVYRQIRYARVFRRVVVRGIRWPHIIMTTNHDFFLLAPTGDIFHLPSSNGEIYLPGTNVGQVSISRLYSDTFAPDDTLFSLTVDLSYDSDNNKIVDRVPSTPPSFFTPNPNLSTTETEQSSPPNVPLVSSPVARANPNQTLLSSDDEFDPRLKKSTPLKTDHSTPLKTDRSTPLKSNSPLSPKILHDAQQSSDSDDALIFNSLPSYLFRFPPTQPTDTNSPTQQSPTTPPTKEDDENKTI